MLEIYIRHTQPTVLISGIYNNYLLWSRPLFKQYRVDMDVKIETERLTFIRLNQAKLRSEEYIHLRGTIRTEENEANIGRLTILLATYISNPRHMNEYAQNTMTCSSLRSARSLFHFNL